MRSRPGRHALFLRRSFREPSDEGYVRLAGAPCWVTPPPLHRADEWERAWRLYPPLLELIEDSPWQFAGFSPYEAGSLGPGVAADGLWAPTACVAPSLALRTLTTADPPCARPDAPQLTLQVPARTLPDEGANYSRSICGGSETRRPPRGAHLPPWWSGEPCVAAAQA